MQACGLHARRAPSVKVDNIVERNQGGVRDASSSVGEPARPRRLTGEGRLTGEASERYLEGQPRSNTLSALYHRARVLELQLGTTA